MTCSGSNASLLPFPLPATVDMQPNPWGFSLAQGPTPVSFVQGEPHSPLLECLPSAGRWMKTSLVPLSTMSPL